MLLHWLVESSTQHSPVHDMLLYILIILGRVFAQLLMLILEVDIPFHTLQWEYDLLMWGSCMYARCTSPALGPGTESGRVEGVWMDLFILDQNYFLLYT